MSELRIGGSTLVSIDPEIEYGGRDDYGSQGEGGSRRLVFGPFESFTLRWNAMTDADFSSLKNFLDGLAGGRTTVSLSITSSNGWTTIWANLKLAGGWRRNLRGFVTNVTVEVSGVSSSA